MKKYLLIFGSIVMLIFSGCAGNNYQIGTPQVKQADNLKDYIIKKNKNAGTMIVYQIVAENPKETVISYRILRENSKFKTAQPIITVLDDAIEYCKYIGGHPIFGDQSIDTLKSLPSLFDSKYSNYIKQMNMQGKGLYEGFFKCESPADGFEIDYMLSNVEKDSWYSHFAGAYMSDYSRFFHIYHNKPQKIGYKSWFESKPIKDKVLKNESAKKNMGYDTNNPRPYSYQAIRYDRWYCSINGGKMYVSNKITNYKLMDINDYIIGAIDEGIKEYSGKNRQPYIFPLFKGKTYFICENSKQPDKSFTLIKDKNRLAYKDGTDRKYLQLRGVSFKKIAANNGDFGLLIGKSKAKVLKMSNAANRLALETLKTMSDKIEAEGNTIYETSYNGKDANGCKYASVIVKTFTQPTIYNFKQCGGQAIEPLGETGVETLTSEAKAQIEAISSSLKQMCKMQNHAEAKVNEYDIKCFKNPNSESYKMIILKDGLLISKKII